MDAYMDERIRETELDFGRLVKVAPRRAAEIAYALARLYRDAGMQDASRRYAIQSIDLFEHVGVNTLEEAAACHAEIAGVCIPSYIHEGVVRSAFADLGL